jgi:hypothetical protein
MFDAPDEKYVELVGSIETPLTYKIRVEYRTQIDTEKCTNYHLSLGKNVAQRYEADYYPQIQDGKHRILAPLKALNPNTLCQWKPVMLFICMGTDNIEPTKCSSLFSFRGLHDVTKPILLDCPIGFFCSKTPSASAVNDFNREYEVNISAR